MIDPHMVQEWIIRVQGRDFGPADLATLREWKAEGRVLPVNEARPADIDQWSTAADIPGLFEITPPPIQSEAAHPGVYPFELPWKRRTLFQIFAETFHIYRQRFFQFLCLALLVILPAACGQLASTLIETTPNVDVDLRSLVASAFAFCMLVLAMVLWPIYIAAIQILSAETLAGRRIGFLAALNEAVKFWPRVAVLCVFVYGVFFLLTMFALAIAAMVLVGASSLSLILFALLLLVIQVWMFGRFFISVLFWQQFAVIEGAGVVDSLRESRDLARSGRGLPWFQRPFWRGAFIVSIWAAFVLAITLGPEWSTLKHYFNEFATAQDPQALLQKLNASSPPHGFQLSSFGFGILKKILQPLLGIAFVVLYFDSKSGGHAGPDSSDS
jgi:hypothetical protein